VEQQQGGLRGAEARSFARGWNKAEWGDWEGVDVRRDLAAQGTPRQGRDMETATSAAKQKNAQALHQGTRRGGDDEALGTIERSGVPGATGGGTSEVVGVAEASENCGNKEEKREAVQVSLTCMSRGPATQLGSETLMSARRDGLEGR